MGREAETSLAPSLGQGHLSSVTVLGEYGVRLFAHERHQLVPVGDVDRLNRHVGLGVAAAVPVKIVPTFTPAPPVKFGNRLYLV